MKKFLAVFLLFIGFFAAGQGVNNFVRDSIPKPNPPRLVNDFVGVLTPEQRQALEDKLVAYDDSTSNQIAVVIIRSTNQFSIEDVGLQILRQWGVGGQASKDNGVVILVALNDRHINISTGYGMEGAVPDITTNQIIENDITPQFRAGNYYRGLDNATTSIIRAAAGEYKAPSGYHDQGGGGISIGKIIFFIFLIIIISSIFGGGGRGGGFMSRRGYRGFGGPIFFPTNFGGGGGFGGFGGGGGGGFGGFGGGSGGGGGASGSW